MPKRTLWFGLGATIGVMISLWTRAKVDKALSQSTPVQLYKKASATTKRLNYDIRNAASAGSVEKQIVAQDLKRKLLNE